jgi:DNA repair protein RadC
LANIEISKVKELNKSSFYFMSYFKQLGLSKGYKITYHTDLFQEYEDTEDKLKIDKITPIINAKDCTQEEFNLLLLKQKQNIATEEDIIRTTKQMYKTNVFYKCIFTNACIFV